MPTPPLHSGHETLLAIGTANAFNRWMYAAISPYLQEEILEAGAGIGNITALLAQEGKALTISEIETQYLDELRVRFSGQPSVKEIVAIDLQEKNFFQSYAAYHERFGSIVLLNVIEHLQDDLAAVEHCRFLLKPGGVLIALAPAYSFLYSRLDKELGHYRRYTRKRLAKVVVAGGLRTTRSFYFNFMGIPAWLYGKWRRVKAVPGGEMGLYDKLVPLGKLLDKLVFHRAGLSAIVIAKKVPA